jgi:gamma-glutamyltranspeptidase
MLQAALCWRRRPTQQPGLVPALELLSNEGAASAYTGTIAETLLALMQERRRAP